MRTIEQIQAHKIQIKARRDFKARNKKKSTKKAKDRTKIQGGALLIVCGLFEFFKIKVGEDLEKSPSNQKAAILLGVLLDFQFLLKSKNVGETQLMEWMKKGMKFLEERKKHRGKKKLEEEQFTREEQNKTKIQGGGLLIIAGLFDYFEIKVGEDLQTSLDGCQKSATLLGALLELHQLLKGRSITNEQIKKWKDKGAKAFIGRKDD